MCKSSIYLSLLPRRRRHLVEPRNPPSLCVFVCLGFVFLACSSPNTIDVQHAVGLVMSEACVYVWAHPLPFNVCAPCTYIYISETQKSYERGSIRRITKFKKKNGKWFNFGERRSSSRECNGPKKVHPVLFALVRIMCWLPLHSSQSLLSPWCMHALEINRNSLLSNSLKLNFSWIFFFA